MRFWPIIKLLPQKTNLRFVSVAKYMAVLSIVGVLGSLFLTLYPFKGPCGGLNCGVDFKGGTLIELSSPRPIDLGEVRGELGAMNLGDVQVQQFGAPTDVMVRFETPEGVNPAQQVDQVKNRLRGVVGQDTTFTRTEVVGPKVSGELLRGGIIALGIAVALMMLYIWFRFEWQFGLGAVAGLLHDTILVFGFFALFKLEFTLTAVAAILTVIGYSMNDTVVVFDRLRENLRKYKKMPLREVIDLTINETLSRTIITGVTAIMALAALAILGGETLFAFSVSLIFGIIFGTYSSIYVGAPIILLWGVKRSEGGAGDEPEPVKLGAASRP
ncbi:protein translocase subunit SecF [Brevundimonas sp. 2R-24]|uniref:Protein-export membrane protein SecF n=1 Tax=Peiella sedimenti TaxID=3061083 RepID=A0ABT8SJT4_9CAUL|nr:protein translocase subunit SecF [Caulobacteraceae bacterium XZ-24]